MQLIHVWILVILGLTYAPTTIHGVAPKGHPKEIKTKSVEKALIRMLLNRYEQYGVIGRPVNDSRIKVIVPYGLQLFQILDLDENKQILRTNCWCMYTWEDALLKWDPHDYGDVKSVRIFPSQIWTPDIKLYNFADERLVEQRVARVVVASDGSTLWVPQALFKSTCEVEITYFPFDTQICMLEFGSWTYDKTQMDITWWLSNGTGSSPMPYVDFSDYVPSNEWRTDGEFERDVSHSNRKNQIRSVKKYRRRYQTVGNQIVSRDYPVLRYLIRLRRNPSFYVFMLIIPCVLLSSLTIVVFWLPPESPAKMMLGMNIFVAFFVLLLLLAESTPSAVKNFPLIGVFFCLNMIMITLSTFLATMVIHLYFRGDRNGTVPVFLRRFVIEGIGRIIMVRQSIPLPDMKKPTSPQTTGKTGRKSHECNLAGNKFLTGDVPCSEDPRTIGFYGLNHSFPPGYNLATRSMDRKQASSHDNPFVPQFRRMAGHKQPDLFDPYSGYGVPNESGAAFTAPYTPRTASNAVKHSIECPPESGEHTDFLSSTATLERDVREVKRYLKMFVNRQKETRRKGLQAMEWRTLALVLDRLFFYLYITTIGIAVVVSFPRSIEPEVPEAFRHRDDSMII